MEDFKYIAPQTLDEAITILADVDQRCSILSGGTDLISQMRDDLHEPDLLIDIKRIPDTTTISFDPHHGLTIGSAVSCRAVTQHPEIRLRYPGLIDAVSLIGGVQIQGRASIGGNLCNASPAADSIPALIVHSAICHVAGIEGWRQVPVEDFCIAPGKTILAKNELLVSVQIPSPPTNFGAHYLRFTPRNEMDIAVVGAGASVVLDNSGKKLTAARVALAAVAPRPLYLVEVGDWLVGKDVSQETIQSASDLVYNLVKPISDLRGVEEQRRQLSVVLTRRALWKAVERAKNQLKDGGQHG